jgi:hypothetical protein
MISKMSGAQQMSISQALVEIKLLKSRIGKCKHVDFITVKTKIKTVDVTDFSKSAKANLQSYKDLLNRYNVIRSKVVVSNAMTRVSVAGVDYTVAEAVERKRSIEMEKDMLGVLRSQFKHATSEMESHQKVQQERLDRLLLQELGKDSKTNVDVVDALTETFLKNNKAELIDPVGLQEVINTMEKSIQDFETNVDWVLSESNGRTQIRV